MFGGDSDSEPREASAEAHSTGENTLSPEGAVAAGGFGFSKPCTSSGSGGEGTDLAPPVEGKARDGEDGEEGEDKSSFDYAKNGEDVDGATADYCADPTEYAAPPPAAEPPPSARHALSRHRFPAAARRWAAAWASTAGGGGGRGGGGGGGGLIGTGSGSQSGPQWSWVDAAGGAGQDRGYLVLRGQLAPLAPLAPQAPRAPRAASADDSCDPPAGAGDSSPDGAWDAAGATDELLGEDGMLRRLEEEGEVHADAATTVPPRTEDDPCTPTGDAEDNGDHRDGDGDYDGEGDGGGSGEGDDELAVASTLQCAAVPGSGGHVSGEEWVSLDLHIVYHTLYQVPMLMFSAHGLDGRMLRSDDVVNRLLVNRSLQTGAKTSVTPGTPARAPTDPVVTQMDHPITGRVLWALHPCRTGDCMDLLQAPPPRDATAGGDTGEVHTHAPSRGLCGSGASGPCTADDDIGVRDALYLVRWFALVMRALPLPLQFPPDAFVEASRILAEEARGAAHAEGRPS